MHVCDESGRRRRWRCGGLRRRDRKSTRLNSSHQIISYAVFCLKKKKKGSNVGTILFYKVAMSPFVALFYDVKTSSSFSQDRRRNAIPTAICYFAPRGCICVMV